MRFPGGARSAYISVYRVRVLMGDVPTDIPPRPACFAFSPITGTRAELGPQGLRLFLDVLDGTSPDVRYKVAAGPPGSVSRKNWNSATKIIQCPATLAELRDPAALGRAYLAKYPLTTVGRVIALHITQAINGQLSQPYTEVVTVTAAG